MSDVTNLFPQNATFRHTPLLQRALQFRSTACHGLHSQLVNDATDKMTNLTPGDMEIC